MTDPPFGDGHRPPGIFCLFDTAEAFAVHTDIIRLDHPGNEPTGHVLVDGSSDFNRSARRAAQKLFHELHRKGKITRPFMASFDLDTEDRPSLLNITGRSGELCFALAAAARILSRDLPHLPDLAVTGLIQADGTIGPVNRDDLTAKVSAALAVLPPGGLIFHPHANPLPEAMGPQLAQHKVTAVPVKTLSDALDRLIAAGTAPAPGTGGPLPDEDGPGSGAVSRPRSAALTRRPLRMGILLALLALAMAAGLLLFFFPVQQPPVPAPGVAGHDDPVPPAAVPTPIPENRTDDSPATPPDSQGRPSPPPDPQTDNRPAHDKGFD